MLKRVLSGIFGTVLFGILAPIIFVLFVDVPNSFSGLVWIVGAGMILGALFPSVFALIFEIMVEVFQKV